MGGVTERIYLESPIWMQQCAVAAYGWWWRRRRFSQHFYRLAAELKVRERWTELQTECRTWRRLLPETRQLAQADWQRSKDWVVKPALGRVGDMVGIPGITTGERWHQICKAAQTNPDLWVVQRYFEAMPMETDRAPLFPCIGVYTVDCRVAGAYGRVAPVPLIDQFAQDAAVLVAQN